MIANQDPLTSGVQRGVLQRKSNNQVYKFQIVEVAAAASTGYALYGDCVGS